MKLPRFTLRRGRAGYKDPSLVDDKGDAEKKAVEKPPATKAITSAPATKSAKKKK